MGTRLDEIDVLPAILQLLRDQQKTSERTGDLVESMTMELGVRFREQSEKIAIITSRLEALEDDVHEFEQKRTSCIQTMNEQLKVLEQKREQNKDSINAAEQKLTQQINAVKDRLQEKIQSVENGLSIKLGQVKEKMAYSSGKYGAIVAFATSLGMMILQWILAHHGASK